MVSTLGACVAAVHSGQDKNTRRKRRSGDLPIVAPPYPGRPFMSLHRDWALNAGLDDMRRRRPLRRPRTALCQPGLWLRTPPHDLSWPLSRVSFVGAEAKGSLSLTCACSAVPVHPSFLRAHRPPVGRLRLANCTNVRSPFVSLFPIRPPLHTSNLSFYLLYPSPSHSPAR